MMSTLLKKKYCHQRRISANTRTVDSDDESNDTSVGTSVQENDIVLDVTAGPVSIPPSPVSVTITNEDCDQSSMAPSIVAEKTECIDGQLGLNTKSVRFHNKNQIFIDNDYSEQVHKHRTDIWYTRGEYRKFWYDRMNTVRLWKCLFDENEVLINGHLGACIDFRWEGKDFTVRGLENYILSSSEEANRHRDLYHVAVLQDPYDADGMLANVCAMSRASLQWAQSYAVQDAIDPYEASSLTPISDRIGNTFPRLQCGSTPPRSPSSILSINKLHRSMETPHDKKLDITCIREMNKRLIKQHLNDSAYHNLSPVQKKLKRRSSSTGCYTLTHRSNLTYPERRHSAASLSKDLRRQPVSLQMHRIPRIDHQHRQPPSMDLNEHMQFCNRLLNDLPIVDHGPYRRDSLTLANSDSKVFHDQIGSNDLGMEDEFVLQQQIISASLCKSRRALFSGIGNDNFASDTSTVPVSYESFNTTVPYENFSDYGDRSLLRQMLQPVHQKPFSTHDSALLEYTNSVRNYSRLRRDSLGGNFGFF